MSQQRLCECECDNMLPEGDGMGTVSSIGKPPQNVPQSVGKNSEAREPYADVPLYGFHGVKPLSYEIPEQHEKNRREQERDVRDAQRLTVEKRAFWVGGAGFVALLFTLGVTIYQTRIARETFQATRRAIVHLAIRDGKVGDFLPGDDVQRIALYFNNSGPSAAKRTVIDVWPITTAPDQPPVKTVFGPPDAHYTGPDIPPGSPHVLYRPYQDATRDELESGVKHLSIVGRVTYSDAFGHYCETFTLTYNGSPLSNFGLAPNTGPDLCDEEEDKMESGLVTVRPGPATQIFPFPEPSRPSTKDNPQ